MKERTRRYGTILRDNKIHAMHKEIMAGFGEHRNAVAKSHIYNLIKERTGLSIRTIAEVLNHTKEVDENSLLL